MLTILTNIYTFKYNFFVFRNPAHAPAHGRNSGHVRKAANLERKALIKAQNSLLCKNNMKICTNLQYFVITSFMIFLEIILENCRHARIWFDLPTLGHKSYQYYGIL